MRAYIQNAYVVGLSSVRISLPFHVIATCTTFANKDAKYATLPTWEVYPNRPSQRPLCKRTLCLMTRMTRHMIIIT
jgi:hypothetical protein